MGHAAPHLSLRPNCDQHFLLSCNQCVPMALSHIHEIVNCERGVGPHCRFATESQILCKIGHLAEGVVLPGPRVYMMVC